MTKVAAEDLCELAHRDHGLPCLVLRTSRFFPEDDDDRARARAFDDDNLKANEFLYRRVDIEDVVERAPARDRERAPTLGFGRYIVSATTPFTRDDLARAAARRAGRGAAPCAGLRGRVRAPRLDACCRASTASTSTSARGASSAGGRATTSRRVIARLRAGGDFRSPLALAIGAKGYHRDAPSSFEPAA